MKYFSTEFKVGIFTLMGLIVIIYLFVSLNPDLFRRKKVFYYYTYLEDAAGIVPKTHVKTNGVSIGKVVEVKLEVNKTRVIIAVDASIKIPVGSTIEVRSVGLLGDSHLEIVRTQDNGEYLRSGDYIPKSEKSLDIKSIISVSNIIANDLKDIVMNFKKVLGDQQGYEKIEATVNALKETLQYARDILAENKDNIRTLFAQAKDIATSLKEITNGTNKEKLERIIASIDDSMLEVKEASKNIKLISSKIEKGEGTLGKLVNNDETIVELESTLKEVKELLSTASKLQVEVATHVESGTDDLTQAYFNIKFSTRPDRYYLIGVTDFKQDEIVERVKHNTEEEGTNDEQYDSSTTTKVEKKHALRFNFQLAKRWYFLALRVGLFESTGGIAADTYFWEDQVKFSLEAFDWKVKDNETRHLAHFKAYLSILFFKHIYVLFGVNDITKYRLINDNKKFQKANIYGGAGITFNDRDLKTLFGAASLKSAF